MREEFHGTKWPEGPFKLLYGWGTLNTKVWLPSLSELIGTDPNHYYEPHGTYYSAMQGLNISSKYYIDAQGGAQFQYFVQFNISGGGSKLWLACNQEVSWLRSPRYVDEVIAWVIDSDKSLNAYYSYTSLSYAVHPAVSSEQVPYLVGANSVSLAYPQRTGEKLAHFIVPPPPKKARSVHLFSCKRIRYGSLSLPPFVVEGRYKLLP